MKIKLKNIVIAATALGGLAACNPQQVAQQAIRSDSGHSGSYRWDVQCDSLGITVGGYPDGTVFYVSTDGAPPLHLTQAEPSHVFPMHVTNYGIYIRTLDGTVVAETAETNTTCG